MKNQGGRGIGDIAAGTDKNRGTGMIKECRFIKTNGLKCQSPAVRGSQFCYFHGRSRIVVTRPRAKDKALRLPPLQDNAAIHAALNQVLQELASGNIDTKRAGNLLYALQMAQQTIYAAPSSSPAPK